MYRSEHYQMMEAKFRHAAEIESDPTAREKLFTHADAWQLLLRAARFISEKQADTNEMLATIGEKTAS